MSPFTIRIQISEGLIGAAHRDPIFLSQPRLVIWVPSLIYIRFSWQTHEILRIF